MPVPGTVAGMTVAALGNGQGWLQVGELLLAFGLSAVIGLEREVRGKSAGLRTQAIVGTAAALILLISKYGFGDVLLPGAVVLDPSRVAAQIVSGIGFLGAGLIITRQGAIHGLTTAAAVWETAAIGMAAGAGLPLLAVVVTTLHFVIVIGFTQLVRFLPRASQGTVRLRVTYLDGQGILRDLLTTCTAHQWIVTGMVAGDQQPREVLDDVLEGAAAAGRQVSVTLTLAGKKVSSAINMLAGIDGVSSIERVDDDTE